MTKIIPPKNFANQWRRLGMATLCGTAMLVMLGGASTEIRAQGVNTPSQAEMWEIIQKQQRQIKQLMKEKSNSAADIESNTVEVADTDATGEETFDDDYSNAGAGWWTRTSIGGYGELHWNNGRTDQIDFHRFVLFINHDFNDWIHFFSELELEHSIAGEGKAGEIELEQAWVRFDIKEDKFGALSNFIGYIDVGQMILPVGIINELHEPPTFFGVERNDVEKNIIMATWWEAGARIGTESIGETGFGYDLMVHSGLAVPTTGSKAYLPRSGRQKVAKAPTEDVAYLARLKYRPTFLLGWEIAGSYLYQEDITNRDGHDANRSAPSPRVRDESATLMTAHIDGKQNVTDAIEFRLRALWAAWDIDSNAAAQLGRDKQQGWYVEPGLVYDSQMWAGKFGLFYRYEAFDNEAGRGDFKSTKISRQTYGASWWPTENLVLKGEYRDDNHHTASSNDNRWDFGLGYQF